MLHKIKKVEEKVGMNLHEIAGTVGTTELQKKHVLSPQPRIKNRPSGDFFGLCKLRAKKYHDLQGNCSDNDTFLNDPGDSGD